ncbi:hypothetical protein NKH47_12270 [Mesorhizobium sp. M1060]|uniref:hypothetical protein n=1 Tax=Mesorhizobium sp. M1060 TaxID=2957052 RepID=UPI00333AAD66
MSDQDDAEPTSKDLDRVARMITNEVQVLEASQPGGANATLWTRAPSGKLGVRVRLEILLRCLQRARPSRSSSWPDAKVGTALWKRMRSGARPIRAFGPTVADDEIDPITKRPYWNSKTYVNFLQHRGVAPSDDFAEKIVRELSFLVAEQIWPAAVDKTQISELLDDPRHSIEALAKAILSRAQLNAVQVWREEHRHRPFKSTSFTFLPSEGSAPNMEPSARRARAYLAMPDGPRAYFVGGPPYSGKKTVLRHFLKDCDEGWFKLKDSSRLPVFAASMLDQTAGQLIDEIYAFYLSGQPIREEYSPTVREATQWKLRRIEAMARMTPACILLADTDPISRDDVFRSLSDGPIDAVVAILLGAHPLTRLLITTGDAGEVDRFVREATRLCRHCTQETLDGVFDIGQITGLGSSVASGKRVSGKTWRLAWITSRLIERADLRKKPALLRQRETLIKADDANGLTDFLWDKLLAARERTLLGVVAISQDGLRLSVLIRILRGLEHANAFDVPAIDSLPETLTALVDLVTEHQFDIEDELLQPGEAGVERLFSVDQDWRIHFLERWWGTDSRRARVGHWLVAREAADQARRLRVAQVEVVSSECTGREIQALHALIASIDPVDLLDGASDQRSGKMTESVEWLVLPPLDERAPMPDPLTALRFAYLCLYRINIEGRDYQLLRVHEDAATRLSLLLPLFAPETPWLGLKDRTLSSRVPSHISFAFEPREIIDLLASIAIGANRLRRHDIMLAAVESGREIFGEAGKRQVSVVNYMRLRRTEFEAGILLAGSPSELATRTKPAGEPGTPRFTNMFDVIEAMNDFLGGDLKPLDAAEAEDLALRTAQAKLLARLGETYHCTAQIGRARRAFMRARELELDIIRAGAAGSTMSPVLGGRGARRYLRLLVDIALRRTYSSDRPTFVFSDGLGVPAMAFPTNMPAETRFAQMLHDINCRRLLPGHMEDGVGLKIDGARIAAMCRQPGHALRLLDAAQTSLRLSSGSDFELVLEFFALRTRLQLDSSFACFARHFAASTHSLDDVVESVRRYLRPASDTDALGLGTELIKRARASKRLLDEMINILAREDGPSTISAELLEAQLVVAETRIKESQGALAVATDLADAAELVKTAMKSMHHTKFRMHLWNAREILRGIHSAISRQSPGS